MQYAIEIILSRTTLIINQLSNAETVYWTVALDLDRAQQRKELCRWLIEVNRIRGAVSRRVQLRGLRYPDGLVDLVEGELQLRFAAEIDAAAPANVLQFKGLPDPFKPTLVALVEF